MAFIPSRHPSCLMIYEGYKIGRIPSSFLECSCFRFLIDTLEFLRSYLHCLMRLSFQSDIIMPYIYYIFAMFVVTTLALASSIPKHPPHNIFTPLHQSSTVGTVHEIVYTRGLIAATSPLAALQASPKAFSISTTNTTAQRPAPSASPSQAFFNLPQQSQWGPGDISDVFFGCVAPLLGGIAIVLTYYVYRRQSSSRRPDESIELGDISVLDPRDDDNALPLEDLPPAYTSDSASPGSLSQQGAGSPVTL